MRYHNVTGTIDAAEEDGVRAWAEEHSAQAEIFNHFRYDGHYSIRVDGLLDFVLRCPSRAIAVLAKLTWGGR